MYLKYRLDGSVYDLRRLNAKTKVTERLILEALFADDCTLMAHKEADLQLIVDKFAEASRLFGLTISLGKTEVLLQSAPATAAPPPSISIDGTRLKTVEDFKYLGSTISSNGTLDKEINARISKASKALGRLHVRVLNQHNIQQSTKMKVYKAAVLSSLLYGCETWTLYRRHLKLLELFHMRSLRSILGIRWQDKISNLEVLDRAKSTSIEAMIVKIQLRWTGHVIRMDDTRIPKQLRYGELSLGKRHQGRPRKRFKDCIKSHLAHAGIGIKQLEHHALDRNGWRALIKTAHDTFEEKRRIGIAGARERRKAAAAATPTAQEQLQCPHCGRLCHSRIGLQSHLRVHM